MNLSLVSVRYSKALFNLSVEKGITDDVYKDITLLNEQCSNVEGFRDFLQNPVIKAKDKKELLKSVFGKVIHPVTLSFLFLIIDNNRENILRSVFLDYASFYRKAKNIRSVTLYSAFEMDDAFRKKIKKLIEKEINGKIELSTVTNPELLGGFILKMDDKMMDASILGKLKKVKEHLIQE
jgi:F-type H+-transporting ATPase subunit delta